MSKALDFLLVTPDAGLLYVGVYSPTWVAVSVLLAILGSYAALRASERVRQLHHTGSKLAWASISAMMMGLGVWAMHFIGMLALSLPCRVNFDPLITLMSMIPGILAGGVAVGVGWQRIRHLSPLSSSILLGIGIGTMHYTGMAAMRLEGAIRYDPPLFALSILVAVALSYLALRIRNGRVRLRQGHDLLVAVVMGGAMAGMHYTAMAAAYFVRGDGAALPPAVLTTDVLAILVAVTAAFLALGALALAAMSRSREMIDQLRDGEKRNRQLMAENETILSNVMVGIAYVKGRHIVACNRHLEEILHYAPGELNGASAETLVDSHQTSQQLTEFAYGTEMANSECAAEAKLRRKDGSLFWAAVTGKPVDPLYPHNGSIWSCFDITERKQNETSLRESQAILKHVFTHTSTVAYVLSPDFVATWVSDNAQTILGYSVAECLAPGWWVDHLHPDERQHILTELTSALDGEQFKHEYRFQYKNGSHHWIRDELNLIRDPQGNLIEIIGSWTDITERREAEEQLRIAATAFESQEGVMITDSKNVILKVNRAFTEMTGYTPEELVGQTPRLLSSGRHGAEFYREMWEIIERTGGWQGEIWDRRKDGEIYPKWLTISAVKNVDGAVTHYVGMNLDVTERKRADERIHHLAFFDQLTGIPNRTLLQDRLKRAQAACARSRSYGALLLIDLDDFKTLNDTQGHGVGDILLMQVAQRLSESVRDTDTVARLGGDEFVVLLAGLSASREGAALETEVVVAKILDAFNAAHQLGELSHHSTASIGITLFKDGGESADDLMKQADLAMYKSKNAGRNLVSFFDPTLESAVKDRVALENDLRQAVQQNQFLLHYQAQVTDEGQLTGAEVLVRWQHPHRGVVSPADFIPLAEETGLILHLGQWVLETACTQLAAWADRPEMAHLTVAVNVSAMQFHSREFVQQVLATLDRTGAKPKRLKLELTESLLASNLEQIIEKMLALKAKGVSFSLDDFGTGYSSLSYLKRLPLDQLKIDQSFVRDVLSNPNDASIAKTIIALAQGLGLGVIAEGVETAAQRDFLADSDCHAYQGYFFSRPLSLEKFEEYVAQA